MTSFLYSAKAAEAATHQLPALLDRPRILHILHDETLLPRILWPSSVMMNRQQTLSGLEGVLSDSKIGVSLLKLQDGVTSVEKVGGGFTMTVTYTVLDAGEDSSSHTLRLREERSVRALKPIASFAKFKEESPVKTQNLLRFFAAWAANGADDATAALESIAEANVQDEKHKDD
ncbi:hypothetical protein ISF_01448 [Cordyceps fumosorosea ARSEF 2679]|uniref:Uncharacterized protein n=1 Tax=Cordyceps fumosorosea (strain ARSEF 2679) TaxID=1081104 RepID=A0A168DAU5_CORFA|nr:hypothetical protein ISF_01448 [Cordyceps fumosorosea ARSEF 2679]OAA72375.1 hypothetical protein ISF_01448 [Cordyceps fumosorosea ARSEF 2679]